MFVHCYVLVTRRLGRLTYLTAQLLSLPQAALYLFCQRHSAACVLAGMQAAHACRYHVLLDIFLSPTRGLLMQCACAAHASCVDKLRLVPCNAAHTSHIADTSVKRQRQEFQLTVSLVQVHLAAKALLYADARQRTGVGDEIERVSVIPRGQTVTRISYKRGSDENYTFVTRLEMQLRIQFLLAGAAAAEVLEADVSTFCNADMREARVRS